MLRWYACSEAMRRALKSSRLSLGGLANPEEASDKARRFVWVGAPQGESAYTVLPLTVHLKTWDKWCASGMST
jgi:hypothetical protein